ncbi:MAG: universal stress protein [Candidatus Aenigmatarchaeota archaeon]
MVEKILVPIKTLGEKSSRAALENAIGLVTEMKTDESPELLILHVIHHNNRVPGYAKKELAEIDEEKIEQEFEEIEALCRENGIKKVQTISKKGDPVDEITKVAEEAGVDLVIIGAGKFDDSKDQWAIGKVVYGKIGENITEEVLQELSRPVLVASDTGDELNKELTRLVEGEGKLLIGD